MLPDKKFCKSDNSTFCDPPELSPFSCPFREVDTFRGACGVSVDDAVVAGVDGELAFAVEAVPEVRLL